MAYGGLYGFLFLNLVNIFRDGGVSADPHQFER